LADEEIGDVERPKQQAKVEDDEDEYVLFWELQAEPRKWMHEKIKNSEHNIMESKTNPEDWQRECERISTRLKLQDRGDTKEWRTHLEQAKRYSEVSLFAQCDPYL
jgi:tRNA G10  N-methylase Trm11